MCTEYFIKMFKKLCRPKSDFSCHNTKESSKALMLYCINPKVVVKEFQSTCRRREINEETRFHECITKMSLRLVDAVASSDLGRV